MKTIKTRYIAALLLFIIMTNSSCSEKVEELSHPNYNKSLTLSFDLPYQFAQAKEIDNSEVVNEDIENRIKKLDILIFDTESGTRVLHEIANQSKFKVRIQEGQYDIYFIGNYNGSVLSSIRNRDAMNKFITEDLSYIYEEEQAFLPLSRVYLKQNITGSKKEDEIFFNPSTDSTHPLSPISDYGYEGENDNIVNLIRAVSKISIAFNEDDINRIQNLRYINAQTRYTFGQKGKDQLNTNKEITTVDFRVSSTNRLNYVLYIPEKIFSEKEEKGWNRDKINGVDEAIGLVNYIEIIYDNQNKVKLPIIYSHPKLKELGYINAARDNQADYNIIRNQHYNYMVKLPTVGGNNMDIVFEVAPWYLVSSSLDFGASQYKLNLYLNDIELRKTLENREIEIHTGDKLRVEFQLAQPEGAIWKASLSNGLDFKFTPTPQEELKKGQIGASMGVGHQETIHSFRIEPKKAFDGNPKYTELYIVVVGNEIQLLENKDLKPAPGHRILIKQVE